MRIEFRNQNISTGTAGNVSNTLRNIAGLKQKNQKETATVGFSEYLYAERYEKCELTFSKHAEERLLNRNIRLTQDELDKISEAVLRAERKGVVDSLVITRNVALIVNIPCKKVVTAIDEANLKENVFTNIDGAVFI